MLFSFFMPGDQSAGKTAEAVRKFGREALLEKVDLEDPEKIDTMFDEIEQRWGKLDILVANAAATAFKSLTDLKGYHLERTAFWQCVISQTPLGRLTSLEDVASLALFLASDFAPFITGQVIRVDGSLSLTLPGFQNS